MGLESAIAQVIRHQIVRWSVEGMSIQAISRCSGLSKEQVGNVLFSVGLGCRHIHNKRVRNLYRPLLYEIDEFWSFIQAKDKTLEKLRRKDKATAIRGSVWIFLAVQPETNLLAAFQLGRRRYKFARVFIKDLRSRLVPGTRPTLISDGWTPYIHAIAHIFGPDNVDYGVVVKNRSPRPRSLLARHTTGSRRFTGSTRYAVFGHPDFESISTNSVENANKDFRMHVRRLHRRTNAISKSVKHHFAAICLYVVYRNFCLTQKVLGGRTPAMAAGLETRCWTIGQLVDEATVALLPV